MNPIENENQQITWTVTIHGSAKQTVPVQELIEQFASQVQAAGARCNWVYVMPMKATAVTSDNRLK